ncbi:hypothetical protein AB5J72_41470 [Streptomyces sp. CG1]|uniref:hypothetical protein n=1 Tax=Streptomyces sp. CG1 TaxID=1287523 RepID=UPI0034E29656
MTAESTLSQEAGIALAVDDLVVHMGGNCSLREVGEGGAMGYDKVAGGRIVKCCFSDMNQPEADVFIDDGSRNGIDRRVKHTTAMPVGTGGPDG